MSYKKLSLHLLHTRTSFTHSCKLLGLDPEWTDPRLLEVVMCDNCGYWDYPNKVHTDPDGTVYCSACHDLETLRF